MEFLQILRNHDTDSGNREWINGFWAGTEVWIEVAEPEMASWKMLAEGLEASAALNIDRLFGSKTYLPAKDSAALAAKAFDLFGMDSMTFISCQS